MLRGRLQRNVSWRYPRFQNITDGIQVTSNKVFYDYDKNSISVKPQALKFFKTNYSFISKAVIFE